jgi:hypothetical protein
MNDTTFDGRCHCGAIGFSYLTAIKPDAWSVRACQCRFCRKHNALSTSDVNGSLHFRANDSAALQRYRFALKTADFLLCERCGVYIGAVIDTAEGSFGIINTHALEQTPADMAEAGAIRYDAENVNDRVSRREERWTPVTAVPW